MLLFEDTYRTIQEPSAGEFKDRGSKFLAFAYPITHEKEVKILIDELKNQHPKANHHCFAFRLGLDKTNFRVNDDGEPTGTAGRPILNVLYSKELTNILIVVVRYFGGTLLGVPGLINAYKSGALAAISNAKIIEKTVNSTYEISFDFDKMNEVMKVIKEFNLKIINQTYDNRSGIVFEIRQSLINQVLGKMEKIEGATIAFKS
jgi:uncharacterized YigZ family protein